MQKPLIAVISGSLSDRELVESVLNDYRSYPVSIEYYVASAHRSPEKLKTLITALEKRNVRVIIGAAGYAAHLPGVIASLTMVPVYGVPLSGSELRGVDALYSIVMMPSGIPVATFGIGESGLRNAMLMACAHLASEYPTVAERLGSERAKRAEKVFVGSPAWTNQS